MSMFVWTPSKLCTHIVCVRGDQLSCLSEYRRFSLVVRIMLLVVASDNITHIVCRKLSVYELYECHTRHSRRQVCTRADQRHVRIKTFRGQPSASCSGGRTVLEREHSNLAVDSKEKFSQYLARQSE